MSVEIKYGDVAVGAKEEFVPTSNDTLYPDNLSDLQTNGIYPRYQNPCEPYSVLLDGNTELLPETETGATGIDTRVGFISTEVSGANGSFTNPLELTLELPSGTTHQYSSQGLTFTFDTYNNIYPKTIVINWYQLGSVIDTKTFTVDNALYFCANQVQNYDKVVITFDNMNMPYSRVRLCGIDYGYGVIFSANELRSVKVIQQLNPISSEIAINTCDFTLDSLRDIPYNFQAKQPLEVYFNENLLSVVFIKKATRKSETLWDISAEDYISLLDGVNFIGGVFTTQDNINAKQLLTAIFATANVPFTIESSIQTELESKIIVGHIPICTCREALMQVLFAISGIETISDVEYKNIYVADTSNTADVLIYRLSTELSQHIPLDRIKQGQKVTDDESVTGVEVTAHTFVANNDTEETELYNADESGTGQGIFVQFSSPCHSLQVTDENGNVVSGAIAQSNANYAIIGTQQVPILSHYVLTGKEYDHTTVKKQKNNPIINVTDLQNIASVDNATLVSANNVDKVLDMCYDYYINKSNITMDILEGQDLVETQPLYDVALFDVDTYDVTSSFVDQQKTKVGDIITADTAYLGLVGGRIEKQSFSLAGNICWKSSEVR